MAPTHEGLFDTLALPRHLELYRLALLLKLHSACPTMYQTMCWATGEREWAPNLRSSVAVFPGEEALMAREYTALFNAFKPEARDCPHHREETVPDTRKLERMQAAQGLVAVTDDMLMRTNHLCCLEPTARPLLCRLFPFGVRRTENPRRAVVVCEQGAWEAIRRKWPQNRIEQYLYNAANLFVPLWTFLTEEWWEYYETTFSPRYRFSVVMPFDFTMNDDLVTSTIRGAPEALRVELLKEMADSKCPACEGKGIEFWDRARDPRTGKVKMLPEEQRRFDFCRTCVLPQLGMLRDGVIVNPHNNKILTATGEAYRGDTFIKT